MGTDSGKIVNIWKNYKYRIQQLIIQGKIDSRRDHRRRRYSLIVNICRGKAYDEEDLMLLLLTDIAVFPVVLLEYGCVTLNLFSVAVFFLQFLCAISVFFLAVVGSHSVLE